MAGDKSFATSSTAMLVLKLLEQEDMYGYQMIEELARRSDNAFTLKAGTLYPLLHDLEGQGLIHVYELEAENGRMRKYYSLTKAGRGSLAQKEEEWDAFASAVNRVLKGGAGIAST
ncbi:helix-turn-helix transcriptional regulator [bacterium]|nr:helix-turn-helix transcriptional regulator [bacterium]